MYTVNLPLALFTIVLRRFIDKLRTPQGAIVLNSAPWLIDSSLFKPTMYAYMFCAGLYYTIKHMQRGTIVSLAQKCSNGAVCIKDKCLRRNWLDHRKSWLMKNLSKNRHSQQKALKYVASLVPEDSSFPHSSKGNFNENANRRNPVNIQRSVMRPSPQQQEEVYGTAPYFDSTVPDSKTSRNRPAIGGILGSKESSRTTDISSKSGRLKHFESKYRPCSGVGDIFATKRNSCQVPAHSPPADVVSCMTLSDDTSPSLFKATTKTETRRKRLPRLRNCLTLRGRRINKNELNCDKKIVRKTRSGRIYGYHCSKPRYKRRK